MLAAAKRSVSHLAHYRIALVLLILLNFGKAVLIIGGGQPFPESDGLANYWRLGTEVAHGDWMLASTPWAFRPPAFPYYFAADADALRQVCGRGDHRLPSVVGLHGRFDNRLDLRPRHPQLRRTLVGLALSFCCWSCSCFMIFLLADNLLCVTLVLYFAAFVAWLGALPGGPRRPWESVSRYRRC